jgi:hypothetical protein
MEKMYGALNIHSSQQLLVETFFTLINIVFKVCVEIHVGLHVIWLLKFSSLNEN